MSYFRRRLVPSDKKDEAPVAPVGYGDEKVLVMIPSFRDGQQCGEVLLKLFGNAKNPDNVVVSLVEQQHDGETFCLEAYCKAAANVDIFKRVELTQKNGHKVISNEEERNRCPRIDQIRVVTIQDDQAKGPPWARALGRHSLGNEDFCLQTSTHVRFSNFWDAKVLKEWSKANNEFAVISSPPQLENEASHIFSVPRTCKVDFLEDDLLPRFDSARDGMVEKLSKPLLAHTWTPGFSFAKCHLEEAAPSDGFLPFVPSDIEAFARYARMWTRGYDVYTPTQNILYQKTEQTNEHKLEWINSWKSQKLPKLEKSLERIRSVLGVSRNIEGSFEKLDNLGIYGIGNRRTLKQLGDFVGIDLDEQQPRSPDALCGNFEWVQYDSEISPMDNLYSDPDDLDPQPEYPLRTNLTFNDDREFSDDSQQQQHRLFGTALSPLDARRVPYGTMFVLWVLGLVYWCHVNLSSVTHAATRKRRRRNKNK